MSDVILVVEDELRIADLVCKYLALERFEYVHAESGEEALAVINSQHIDLVLLDLMLPGIDGIEVCSRIRQSHNMPIIMLTARVDEIDRLIGFAKGADDYVCKPFMPKELMARINAVLRRVNKRKKIKMLSQGDLVLDTTSYAAKLDDTELNLTKIEFTLLATLMTHPNKVFTREELLTSVQGKYSVAYERNIDTHIKNIRKKIDSDISEHSRIKSIYGVGYKLDIAYALEHTNFY